MWFVAESSDVFWTLFASIGLPFEQGCGFGMFIPDPDFFHPGSRIPDPTTATKEKGEKFVFYLFL
jgi:hypothetical protein